LASFKPQCRPGPRESARRQAERLALVLREELTLGRVVLDADHYAIVRKAFPVDVLSGDLVDQALRRLTQRADV
jgi:hypothetical protein